MQVYSKVVHTKKHSCFALLFILVGLVASFIFALPSDAQADTTHYVKAGGTGPGVVSGAGDTQVKAGWAPCVYDINLNGKIGYGEMVKALIEYLKGEISYSQMVDVLMVYLTGETCSCYLEMVPIPGGSFQMGDLTEGDGYYNELPVHTVTLSPFEMAQYEVSYAEWMEVKIWAEANGYTFNMPGDMGSEGYEGTQDETHPVTDTEWYDAVLWCNALSEMEGHTLCYYTSGSQTTVYRSGRIDIENNWVDWDANGYRLPTEAEWEYACRADTTTKYNVGDTIDGNDANYWDSGDGYDNGTTPVGYYPANDWGLYDMHGNVWEWCWDWYKDDYYSTSPLTDPKGLATGSRRVLRGGSWGNSAPYLRSANRDYFYPGSEFNIIGFRLVRSSPTPTVSDDVEDVLRDILDKLIVAYTQTDGATAAYQGQNVKTLPQLEQGNAYFVYSVKDVTLELPDDINQQIVKGWQLPAWIAADAPASTTLSEYKDSIYFVIGTDSESDGFKLYISPAVTPLTTIQVGQEYCYITGLGPGNPTCITRQKQNLFMNLTDTVLNY